MKVPFVTYPSQLYYTNTCAMLIMEMLYTTIHGNADGMQVDNDNL
jgi:hypothetical protein